MFIAVGVFALSKDSAKLFYIEILGLCAFKKSLHPHCVWLLCCPRQERRGDVDGMTSDP